MDEKVKSYDQSRQEIIRRLKRIEGQVKGVQKMIEEEKYCVDVLTQIAAIRAAVNKVGGLILENHSMRCIQNAAKSEDGEQVMKELLDTVQKFLKFVD